MKITVTIDKADYPSPGEVGQCINDMVKRADSSNYYSAPIIDDAIMKLRQFRELLMDVYAAENDTERRKIRRLKEGEDILIIGEKDL
jgi:hypothetical protein